MATRVAKVWIWTGGVAFGDGPSFVAGKGLGF